MAWGVVGTSTLGGTADIVEFTGATGTVFNTILTHTIGSGAVWNDLKLNSDGGSLYAQRRSKNGAADTLITSQAKLTQESYGTSGEDVFSVGYLTAISGEEKLYYGFGISGSTKGAGTAPIRNEHAAKYVPSVLTDTMTDFARVQGSSGDYLIDSNISVLGSDLTPSAAVPFAENAQVGSRAEITDTRKMYHKVDTVTGADISLSELKAYWKFNETSGDIVNQSTSVGSTDSLGTGADLQVTGATYNNSNTPFNTMNFDGTNDVAIAGTSLSQFNFMHNGGKWTVSMWASINSITDEGLLFSNQTGTNTYSAGILQGGDGSFTFRVYDSGIWVDRNLGSPGLVAGTMYLLTFTFDKDEATDKATFYRNAVEIATGDQRIAQGTSSNATTKMGVGAGGNSANWLGCKVAEMSIWNRILTDAEITTLYNSGSGKVIDTNTWKEEGT